MEKTNSDKELYYSFVKVLNNYLFKNYSKKFINSLKRWNIIKSSIKSTRYKILISLIISILVWLQNADLLANLPAENQQSACWLRETRTRSERYG